MKPVKVVNNKIYIKQGETPTYDAIVKDDRTGLPFRLDVDIDNAHLLFSIRTGVYIKDNNTIVAVPIELDAFPRFSNKISKINYEEGVYDSDIIIDIELIDLFYEVEGEIDYSQPKEPANTNEKNFMHRDENGTYWLWVVGVEGVIDRWEKYEFRIVFPILREFTKNLDSKTYWYEIALFGDNYKEVLLEAHEFIVGGSLSE